MKNDATKYPVTEGLTALKSSSFGAISSQAAEQSVEGSTTTQSNPVNTGRNGHEWADRRTLVGMAKQLLQSLYGELGSLEKVAGFVGVSKKSVLNKMKSLDIPRRKRDRIKTAEGCIVSLLKQGIPTDKISQVTGLSDTAVRIAAHGLGIALNDLYHKGYILTVKGYKLLSCPEHPNCDSKGYVREHILVMESVLGRYLREGEIVHHLNEDTLDNRPENLAVTSREEHIKIHNPLQFRHGRLSA